MACKICNCFFRFLFAMTLVLIAIKGCNELNDNKGFVSQNLRLISEKIPFTSFLIQYRCYSGLIIIVENYLLVFTACFLLFKSKLAKVSGLIAILIELILVHNPLIYAEPYNRTFASYFVGLLFGILMN